MQATHAALSRTVRLFPWYIFFRDCLFWGPVFFLYFSSALPLSQVLWLEAIYYIGVAVLEVPSGYVSDKMGRRPTLLFSTACLVTAYLLFFIGDGFWPFAAAQVFLASGFACATGTDTALHFECLKELGKEEEYAGRETRALKLSFMAGAVSALAGGAIATFSLGGVYVASAVAGIVAIVILLFTTEPPSQEREGVATRTFLRQIPFLLRKSWSRRLRFFTLFAASMTVMVHMPYEFYQPYVERATTLSTAIHSTPMTVGLHLAATMLVGSWCTRFVQPLNYHCKIRLVLLACLGAQVLLMGLMGLAFSPVVAVLLLGRTAAKAIANPLVNAEVAPVLEKNERSTYLSILSLLGRLCYGATLAILPLSASLFEDTFQGTLVSAATLGAILWLAAWITPFPKESACQCCGAAHHHTHESGAAG